MITVSGMITAKGGIGSGGVGPAGPTGGACSSQSDCASNEDCLGASSEFQGNCYLPCPTDGECPGESYCSGSYCHEPQVCTGGGGGGSGGVIKVEAPSMEVPGGTNDHFHVGGGDGGEGHCTPAGDGGQGGDGLVILP